MTYRTKTCPQCYTEHKQRGPYCSKSCSNKGRTISKATIEKHRENTTRMMNSNTDTAEKIKWALNASRDEVEEGLPMPTFDDLGYGQFRADGDLWEEK